VVPDVAREQFQVGVAHVQKDNVARGGNPPRISSGARTKAKQVMETQVARMSRSPSHESEIRIPKPRKKAEIRNPNSEGATG